MEMVAHNYETVKRLFFSLKKDKLFTMMSLNLSSLVAESIQGMLQ